MVSGVFIVKYAFDYFAKGKYKLPEAVQVKLAAEVLKLGLACADTTLEQLIREF